MDHRRAARAAPIALALALAAPLGAPAQPRDGGGGAAAPPVCAPGQTDDAARPLPAALVPRVRRAFGLERLPEEVAVRTTVVRCDGGRLMACNAGADLPCGKADARREIPAADAWCRREGGGGGGRGEVAVPAYVVGHATLYAWACRGGRAVPARRVAHADARGFVAEYWRALE